MSRLSTLSRSVDRRVLAVCLLGVVAALAGCGSALDGDDGGLPDSDEITETYESLDAYSAEFVATFSNESRDSRQFAGELILRPGTGEAYQRVNGSDRLRAQTVVSNGTVVWRYNETANEVVRTEAQQNAFDRRESVRRVVNQIQMNESDDSGSAGLPLVPLGPGIGTGTGDSESPDGLNVSTTASYAGTEPVGDREAHVLTLESTGGSETRGRWTYYLDTEWYVILRTTTNLTVGGERIETEFRLRNLSLDPAVPAERFEFTPPENATVVDSDGTERYQSREQLAAAANLSVPDPDVPSGFEFSGGERLTYDAGNRVESVSLRYTDDVVQLTVSRRNITFDGPLGENEEPIQVGNRIGTYREFPRQSQLRWQCPDTTQFVTGPLSRETLVDIAESVEC